MGQFLQQLINGIQIGSIYALIALGYTMVYGIVKLINFAHADIFMVGATWDSSLPPSWPRSLVAPSSRRSSQPCSLQACLVLSWRNLRIARYATSPVFRH